MSFLDNAGVERLWQKMKAYVASMTGNNLTFDRVYPVGSIYLSVNNVTRYIVWRYLGGMGLRKSPCRRRCG